ncbi:MAG: LytTR family transcriptional regulator [Bacteroidales bacterium]|nr:LytTR family transcriptional regulator [Bacteroidales bacterium]
MNNKPYISLLGQQGIDIIHLENILYVYSQERTVNFVLQNEKNERKANYNIGFLEKILEEATMFVRCHNRYIINVYYLQCIRKGHTSLLLKNGSEIPISKTFRENFKEKVEDLCIKLHK